jgi:surface polysaccharide O-acyltransferase-like enzyme
MQNSFNSNYSDQNRVNNNPTESLQKFEGFDFLRAVFAIAIVAYKTNIFLVPYLLIDSTWTYGLSTYILGGMYGAMAVPVFLQISLFLFYNKTENAGFNYFLKNRLPKLLSLYLFWVGGITVFDFLFIGKLETIKNITSSTKAFLEFIISGNNTPYFFFFSLIFVTIFAQILNLFLKKIDKELTRINLCYYLLFAACILIFISSIFEPITNHLDLQNGFIKIINNITQWNYNPLNFLPYIFTASITMQDYKQGKLENKNMLTRKLGTLIFFTLIFFVLEWILTSNHLMIQINQASLDHYMRLSLVFGSWFLLYVALLSKYKVPKVIKFISANSLGIYGFHELLLFRGVFNLNAFFPEISPSGIIVKFLVVLAASLLLSLLFKKLKWLKKFV